MVKKVMKRAMGTMILAVILVLTMFCTVVLGAELSLKEGQDGSYSIKVINKLDTTGISINGDWFHAYQILESSNLTTYSVHEKFEAFFSKNKKGGDNKWYNFETALAEIGATTGDENTKATNDYNQLVGKYLESYYTNDPYNLVVELREYVETDAVSGNLIECIAHDKAIESEVGKIESVTLEGLTEGYYFVLDEASTLKGVGVAASGALVPIGEDLGDKENVPKEVHVKNSIPAVDKKILHNDLDSNVNVPSDVDAEKTQNGQWDKVGDYEIGDKAYFLITSTLPNNIDGYNFDTSDLTESENTYEDYYYMLSDKMSDGISYNDDAVIYMDKEGTKALDKQYYQFTTGSSNTFQIQVNVKGLKADDRYKNATVLYTHYTGIVNENAKVSDQYEDNTITLEFNRNPSDSNDKGDDTATVYSYTFDLQVDKMDEHNQPLAGAKFGIYNGATWIKVQKANTVDGVDHYYIDTDMTISATDTGYIVTSDTGKFVINGFDDKITYVLKEEAAPENYNPIEPISFKIEASYSAATGKISILADNSTFIKSLDDQSGFESDIINRKKVILPSTGGIGTILFRIIGGLLMIVAVVYLLLGTKRKSKKEM